MTDQEMIEAVATGVMGMHRECRCSSIGIQVNGGCVCGSYVCFNPLTSDADCMRAWDRFSEGKTTTLIRQSKPLAGHEWRAIADTGKNEDIEVAENADHRRAMVTCMAKATEASK